MGKKAVFTLCVLVLFFSFGIDAASEKSPLTPKELLKMKRVADVKISPDGKWIAYTVMLNRSVDEAAGSAYRELHVLSTETKINRPFITGKESISSIKWSPDSKRIGFIARRGKDKKRQVWEIGIFGGEAKKITDIKGNIRSFNWHPSKKMIAYTATRPQTKKEKLLKKKGYGFIFYEENLKHANLFLFDTETGKRKQITKGMTVTSFEFAPDGRSIVAGMIKKNLVDYSYMFKNIYQIDLAAYKRKQITNHKGKLGSFYISPDNRHLVYTASLDLKDHAVSQVYLKQLHSGKLINLTPKKFKGHVSWARFKNSKTIVYGSGEGVYSTIRQVGIDGKKRKLLLHTKKTNISVRGASFDKRFRKVAFSGSHPSYAYNVYYWLSGQKQGPVKVTDINGWLSKKSLGRQEVVRFKARDGMEIEGLLIKPVGFTPKKRYPLIVLVHGGPEAHRSQGWLSRYSEPGQVLAGKGYLVYYPNYRASTGYGTDFALEGYMDPAGKEFDDIADSIEHFAKIGMADPERVGLGGGSYGGYAAAWFGTYYTKYVKAVCMFVGISNLISKRGTTDIPYEELYVHSGEPLEKNWIFSLKRSPVYWAHQSKTAFFIFGGAADPRVHPTQSLELYRRLKMNNHPAVRLVQYPGEGHGNRKQPGQIDVLYRTLLWYDWYVKDKKPLNGPMPPLDISEYYGIKGIKK